MGSISLLLASYTLTIFILLVQSLSLYAAQKITNKTSHVFPAILAFGDSIIDPGNNNNLPTLFRCNFSPYGKDFIEHKATGRFSNGKISTDFLAEGLGVKELLPAYSQAKSQDLLTGVSFASGSTGYDNLTSQLASVISMSKQLEMFKEYKEKLVNMTGVNKAASIISGSLYIISGGSNDVVVYCSTPLRDTQYDTSSYVDFLTRTAINFIKELINLGARKITVWGVPPIGCVPFIRTVSGGLSRNCSTEHNYVAKLYNSKLSSEVQKLTSDIQGAKTIYIDIYSYLLDLIENPQKYDFEESTKGCCGTGFVEGAVLCNTFSTVCKNTSNHVFWDSFHSTERANQLIVDHSIEKYIHLLN